MKFRVVGTDGLFGSENAGRYESQKQPDKFIENLLWNQSPEILYWDNRYQVEQFYHPLSL